MLWCCDRLPAPTIPRAQPRDDVPVHLRRPVLRTLEPHPRPDERVVPHHRARTIPRRIPVQARIARQRRPEPVVLHRDVVHHPEITRQDQRHSRNTHGTGSSPPPTHPPPPPANNPYATPSNSDWSCHGTPPHESRSHPSSNPPSDCRAPETSTPTRTAAHTARSPRHRPAHRSPTR